MKMTAAVLYGANRRLVFDTIDLADPKPREVRVRVVATGVCGTDLHAITGALARFELPAVLGHEAAGIVDAVGADVVSVQPGDHVLVGVYPGCGVCAACFGGLPAGCQNLQWSSMADGTSRLSKDGEVIHHFVNVSSFAQYLIATERGCIKVRNDAPLDKVCLISCGVTTGLSAVMHTAQVPIGASAVVFGCGGVGLNIIQGLVLAGASTIVGVDVSAFKLSKAAEFGATVLVDATKDDPVAATRSATGGHGADFGFEAIGSGRTIRQTFDATRLWGAVTVVGGAPTGDVVTLPSQLGRTIANGGIRASNPWQFFPALVDMYMAGRLKVDELISNYRPFSEVNEALDDLRGGDSARTVLLMDLEGA